jgi:hypothetical protein
MNRYSSARRIPLQRNGSPRNHYDHAHGRKIDSNLESETVRVNEQAHSLGIVASLWSFWSRGQPVERVGYIVGELLLVSGLTDLAILVIGGDRSVV